MPLELEPAHDAYPETLQRPLTPKLLTGEFDLDRLSIRIDLVDDRLVAWGGEGGNTMETL